MKFHFRKPLNRPSWWPENEPWPPPPKFFRRHGIRGNPFFIRFGCLFPLFFLLTGILCTMLGATAGLGFAPPSLNIPAWVWVAIPIGLVFFIWALVVLIIRRLVGPMGTVLDASDRMAAGDYSTRLSEHGLHDFRGLALSFNSMSDRLQVYDQQRKRLLADISHELRTPLTVLQGNVEGMLDNIYPRDDEHLHSILEETHILSRLIDDLRTISLAETGRLSLQKEPRDARTCIRDLVEAMHDQAASQQIQLVAEANQDIPIVELDPARIRQVLENLISNALRHTPANGSIHVGCRYESAPTEHLTFFVRDTGRGIAPIDLPNIFDRYYKSTDSGGTGLGLAIAKQLIEAHGGTIQAESALGQGTTIRFNIPVRNTP
jgi:signal transduction histidine kinase